MAALLCGRVEDVEIREGDSPWTSPSAGRTSRGGWGQLPCQDLLLFTPLQPGGGQPLRRVAAAVAAVSGGDPARRSTTPSASTGSGAGRRALRRHLPERGGRPGGGAEPACWPGSGPGPCRTPGAAGVRDFVAVGDVDIRVIGGGRAHPGQRGAGAARSWNRWWPKTGIPPFMLGLSWSSTERMSSQQADLLTTEITAIRADADAGGGADLPAVAADARVHLRL